MSEDNENKEEDFLKLSSSMEEEPSSKISDMLQEIEMLAVHKGRRGGIDISTFSETQKDKILDIMASNESNAFAFHSKRLETVKEIEIKRLETSIVNQKTLRIIVLGIIIAVPIITLLIMFYKDEYFIPWLTFLAGLAGGTGINKISKFIMKTPQKVKLDDEDE